MFLFNKCPLKPAGNEGGEQGLREACYQSDSHLSFYTSSVPDLQSFLKRTQPQLLSLSIPTFISISLSCLIETVLRFTHTEPFIKNASYKKSTMQLLNLGSTKASSFRFHLWENRVPKGPTLIHLSLEDSLFKAQWSSSFELWMQTGGTCQQMITVLDWFQLQMIGKKPVKRMYYH